MDSKSGSEEEFFDCCGNYNLYYWLVAIIGVGFVSCLMLFCGRRMLVCLLKLRGKVNTNKLARVKCSSFTRKFHLACNSMFVYFGCGILIFWPCSPIQGNLLLTVLLSIALSYNLKIFLELNHIDLFCFALFALLS